MEKFINNNKMLQEVYFYKIPIPLIESTGFAKQFHVIIYVINKLNI